MDEKTYEYMKQRVERYKKLDEIIVNLNNVIKRIENYPDSSVSVNISGVHYYMPKDFGEVLEQYIHEKVEENEAKKGEI